MNILRIITSWFFIFLAAGVGFLMLSPELPLPIRTEVKIVKSGSMEPTIMTGAAVLIVEQDAYQVGDIITFTSAGANIPTTHRIIASETLEGRLVFMTKGDANEEVDTAPVVPSDIIGRVMVDVPYLGFIFDFARQPLGFALLIGIPALLIIIDEVEKIYRELRRRAKRTIAIVADLSSSDITLRFERPLPRTARVVDMCRKTTVRAVGTPVAQASSSVPDMAKSYVFLGEVSRSYVIAFAFIGVSLLGVGGTLAFGSDSELASDNKLVAGAANFTLAADTTSVTFLDGEVDGAGEVTTLVVEEPESAALRYSLKASYVSGSDSLCAGLQAKVTNPFVYNGPLLSLVADDVTSVGEWLMALSLAPDTNYTSGDTCTVALDLTGWNDTFAERFGHYDEEQIVLTITALDTPPAPAASPLMLLETTEPVTEPAVPLEEAPVEEPTTPTDETVTEPAPEPVPEPEPEPAPEPTPEPVAPETPELEPAPETPTPEVA